MDDEVEGVDRRDRLQDLRFPRDPADAAHRKRGEPGDHHRTEELADRACPEALHQEQRDDDHHGDRDHQVLQGLIDDLESLDRGQHRDRRGDHAVAEEQRGAEQPQHRQAGRRLRPVPDRPPAQQGDQGHDAALAVVVDAHREQHIGDGDDQRHRPDDQRDDPEDVVPGGRDRMRIGWREHRLEGVDRTRPDVTEDDAERARPPGPDAISGEVRPSGWTCLDDNGRRPQRAGRERRSGLLEHVGDAVVIGVHGLLPLDLR